MSSRIPGFYKLTPDQRVDALRAVADVLPGAWRDGGLELHDADVMIENVVGTFALPNAVAVNFLINGEDRLVPMAVEEPSIVAAVSNMARLVRPSGGFTADGGDPVMIGQVQIPNVSDPAACEAALRGALPRLEHIVRAAQGRLEARGGGFRGFEIRHVRYARGADAPEDMVVLHVLVDCRDAMGANLINTACEHLAPHVEEVTGLDVGLRILSNLADRRRARARVAIPAAHFREADLDGVEVAQGIASAWRFAWADPYRAATHNKGVMNGIDAVAMATGNDWRAIEAGAHAWCCRDGQYRPMTEWRFHDGVLYGEIDVPLQFGTVGGPIKLHPTVRQNLGLLRARGAQDLAAIAAAVGLAQNLGALRALATEGIQAGHMRMHARSVAATAGARGHEVAFVAAQLVEDRDFSPTRATQVLEELRRGG